MNRGETPIGAAKGKQPSNEALCQTPQGPCKSMVPVRTLKMTGIWNLEPHHTPKSSTSGGSDLIRCHRLQTIFFWPEKVVT